MVTGPLVPASGPSRNVRPENDAHRSPPGGVLDPRNPKGIPSGPTASPSVPRPCLAAPLDALTGRTSREGPLGGGGGRGLGLAQRDGQDDVAARDGHVAVLGAGALAADQL